MHLENLKKQSNPTIMKDDDLLTHFSLVVQKEREAAVVVIGYLSEIEKRKLYLKEAYSSLFSFVTQRFHYSEGAAYRRIQASKASELYPEVLELLSAGKVSLMTLSLIEPHLKKGDGKGLIEKIVGKSKREVESLLSELSLKKVNYKDIIRRLPLVSVKKEEKILAEQHENDKKSLMAETPAGLEGEGKLPGTFRGASSFPSHLFQSKTAQNFIFTGGNSGAFSGENANKGSQKTNPLPKQEIRRIKIEFVAKEQLAQKIERAKEILRHKFPEGKFEDIFNQALDDMLEKRDPRMKIERAEKRRASKDEVQESGKPKIISRHIAQKIKRKVWLRDGGQCTYESSTGKRCGTKDFLQMDHLHPFALGGESREENLRLLCSEHNRWRAELTFGKWG
jgi:hypothetical protein